MASLKKRNDDDDNDDDNGDLVKVTLSKVEPD